MAQNEEEIRNAGAALTENELYMVTGGLIFYNNIC